MTVSRKALCGTIRFWQGTLANVADAVAIGALGLVSATYAVVGRSY